MRVRAHHILCIQGFQGYGYNQDFIDNMASVVRSVVSEPELALELVEGSDVICAACPYNDKGICVRTEGSDNRTKEMDRKVLHKFVLRKGQTVTAGEVLGLAEAKLRKTDVEEICGECEWKTRCLFFISRTQGGPKLP